MGMWVNENDNIIRIRSTSLKYAKDFIEKGSIKFNTPDTWSRYALEHGNGRGDSYEGTIAFCHYQDIERLNELEKKYNSRLIPSGIYTERYQNRILFKKYGSMHLPCFCLYILRVSNLDVPTETGKQKFNVSIPGSYFKDFADNKTQEEILELPECTSQQKLDTKFSISAMTTQIIRRLQYLHKSRGTALASDS